MNISKMLAFQMNEYQCRVLLGRIECDSRIRWEDGRGIGEGRYREIDKDGVCIFDSGWEPTGIELVYEVPRQTKFHKFLRWFW